jgi:hypothetical protein
MVAHLRRTANRLSVPLSALITRLARYGGTLACLAPLAIAAESTQFYAEDIKAAMGEHLNAVFDKDGHFRLTDDVTEEALVMTFMEIHDPVRQMDGDTYFACTDFHPVGEEAKVYDIDFWLQPTDGELKVVRTKVHKEPRRSLFGWYKHPRYTFVGNDIEYLYED